MSLSWRVAIRKKKKYWTSMCPLGDRSDFSRKWEKERSLLIKGSTKNERVEILKER